MKLWRWDKGRQDTGYEKSFIAGLKWPLCFDLYLLRLKKGAFIHPHVDKVNSGRHYRLNIILNFAEKGGEFICDSPLYCSPRIKYFRPDISRHSVSEVIAGTRYVLSLGWVKDKAISLDEK